MNIFQLAQAARDASVHLMKNHQKFERDPYVKLIIENAKEKISVQQATELLNTLHRPREAYPQQVERAFLLAIRSLYRSIDGCRTIARPLTEQGKRDHLVFEQLKW